MSSYLVILTLFFAFPDIDVKWTDHNQQSLNVAVKGEDTLLEQCIKSGLAMQYRFKFKHCYSRTLFFDNCTEELVQKHKLQSDSISNSYNVNSDRYGDDVQPVSETFEDRENALENFSTINALSLSTLRESLANKTERSKREYLSLKVESTCDGDFSKVLSKISSLLTFGIVRLNGFDTGWIDFALSTKKIAPKESPENVTE